MLGIRFFRLVMGLLHEFSACRMPKWQNPPPRHPLRLTQLQSVFSVSNISVPLPKGKGSGNLKLWERMNTLNLPAHEAQA